MSASSCMDSCNVRVKFHFMYPIISTDLNRSFHPKIIAFIRFALFPALIWPSAVNKDGENCCIHDCQYTSQFQHLHHLQQSELNELKNNTFPTTWHIRHFSHYMASSCHISLFSFSESQKLYCFCLLLFHLYWFCLGLSNYLLHSQ